MCLKLLASTVIVFILIPNAMKCTNTIHWIKRFLRANLNKYFGREKYRIVCQEIKIAILVELSFLKLCYIPLYVLRGNLQRELKL